jgi:serine/threonine protein kinase
MASELIPVPRDLDFDVTIRGLNATQKVFGRYNLRRILGRGGMGIVWLGHDEQLDREVALKFLPDDVFFDAAALDELKRETRRCLDLTHPHIIRIYDFIKDDQAAAISMEYIDGKSLAELRVEKPERVFEVDEIRGWVTSICQALNYAHAEAGVVHRDLKPANLMITSRGQIKIADFGISQSMTDSMSRRTIRRGTSSGTLAYMSPQQLNGEVARPSDDIYALGATLYELLTGKPPFHSGDVPFQIRLGVPKSLTERRAEFEIVGQAIPPEWEETLEACLSKIPSERPASMGEVAERLGLAGKSPFHVNARNPAIERPKKSPVAAIGLVPPLPMREPGRWSPTVVISSALALVITVALVGFVLGRSKVNSHSQMATAPVVLAPAPVTPPAELAPVPTSDPAPIVDKSGSLVVDSSPQGAAVRIQGQPDQVTPATYSKLAPGRYQVSISKEGYEIEQSTVTVASNAKANTGALQLRRTVGDLNIVSVPPQVHYTAVGVGSIADVQREGATPDLLTGLPSGSYVVTFTDSSLPVSTSNVVVAAHQKVTVQTDLVDRAITHDASVAAASAFHGSTAVSTLGDGERNELIGLSNRAFQLYLNAGLLDQASGQLDILRGLHQDTATLQAELVSKSSTVEQSFASEIQGLVAKGKFATADERLRQLHATFDQSAVSRIEGPSRDQLTQYRMQIDSALQASQVQAPETAAEPLQALRKQYPDDLKLILAEAQVKTRMPPVSESLAAQLKTLQKFGVQNKTFTADPSLACMEQMFVEEQRQLDVVTQDLKTAKKGPATLRNEIDQLEEREGVMRRRRVGAPKENPFSTTINFFGKAVTGHKVVDKAPYFDSSEDRRAAIAEVQEHIDQDRATLAQPSTSVQDAQSRYDAFMAQVPWKSPPPETQTNSAMSSTAVSP